MVYGQGCDITQVERIRRVFHTKKRQLRCFSPREIDLVGGSSQRLAGNFAAKEAVAKALGTGFRGFNFQDVEILRDEYGRPFLTADAQRKLQAALGLEEALKFHISISHEKAYAVATCLIERLP